MAILRHFLIFVIRQLTNCEQVFWGQDWGHIKGSPNKFMHSQIMILFHLKELMHYYCHQKYPLNEYVHNLSTHLVIHVLKE